MITIDQQIKCVERELALRRRVYPAWVSKGRMKQADADREIETMEAVLKTVKDSMYASSFLDEALNSGEGTYRP